MSSGHFFSQGLGYAAHALGFMAKKPFGELSTLPELGEWMRSVWPGASEAYLSNVLQRLARGGLLRSHRGTAGGYSLAHPADRLSLRAISEILDGAVLERCALSLDATCPGAGGCFIRRTLRRLEEQFLTSLEQVSVADLAAAMRVTRPKT